MSKLMSKVMLSAKKFVVGESGATMVEYGLIVALIAVVALAAVTAVGTGVASNFNNVAGELTP